MLTFRRGLLALGLFMLAVLAGCANTAATRTADGLQLDLQAKQGEGFAVLRVVALRPISLLNPKWQSVYVTDANGRRHELLDITRPANAFFSGKYYPTESLYFAKLPAGKYDVSGFGNVGPGPGLLLAMIMSDQASAGARLPALTVQAGRLANLGTVVFAPEIKGENKDQLFLLNGPMGKQSALGALLSEAKRPDVALTEGGGWATEGTAPGEQRLLAQAREHASMLYLHPADKGFNAGSHLGQIFRRTGPARLERESIDTLGTVFTAARAASGHWVAGGEYGTYYVKNAQGTWQTHRLPGDPGRVVYIEPRGAGGVLLVTTEARQSRFWTRDALDNAAEAPKEVAKVPVMPDSLLSTPTEWVLAGNIPGISRETELVRVQKADFSQRKQTEKFWVMEWQQLPTGEVMLTRQNGMSAYPSRSADGAKTWTHGQTTAGISTYWLDARRAYSLDWKMGFSTVDNLLMKTTDGGQSFQRLGVPRETPDFAARIIHADANEVLIQGGNMLYATQDEGKTWTRVRLGK